ETLRVLGRFEEALPAYDGCLRSTPIASDCRGSRAETYEALGRCKEMEEDFRRELSSNPNVDTDHYDGRARALYALGQPQQTVLEALLQKWTQLPAEQRPAIELLDRALLDFDDGSFGEAEARGRAAESLIASDPHAWIHASFASLLVRIYVEIGKR